MTRKELKQLIRETIEEASNDNSFANKTFTVDTVINGLAKIHMGLQYQDRSDLASDKIDTFAQVLGLDRKKLFDQVYAKSQELQRDYEEKSRK